MIKNTRIGLKKRMKKPTYKMPVFPGHRKFCLKKSKKKNLRTKAVLPL